MADNGDTSDRIPDSSPYAQKHLDVLQGIIQRMAGNSSAAKTWCITIVSALLALGAGGQAPALGWITLLPVLMFWVMDSYYLSLERAFIKLYRQSVYAAYCGELKPEDLRFTTPLESSLKDWWSAFFSTSVLVFYPVILLLIVILEVLFLT